MSQPRRVVVALVVLLLTVVGLAANASPTSALVRGPGGWTHVGGGLGDQVNAMTTDASGRLIVAGHFTDAGGVAAADRVASWDGRTWRAFGPDGSIPGAVNDVLVHDGKVYVAGTFANAGGNASADNLAMWDGNSWEPFCAALNARALALEVIGDTLYVGGSFTDGAGISTADGLLLCDLNTGAPSSIVPADGQGGEVLALAVDSASTLYIGGQFINYAGIAEADYVVRYAGGLFGALGGGSTPGSAAINSANVDALATDGTDLYVGTDDTDVADIPEADFVVKWDGVAWSALGTDTVGDDGYVPDTPATEINAVHVLDGRLYATGRWIDADGKAVHDSIAEFSGGAWRAVGSNGAGNGPFRGIGRALHTWRGALVLGGGFVDAGGDPLADRLAAFPPTDVTAPTTRVTSRPPATIRTTKKQVAVTLRFTGTDGGAWPSPPVRFRCRVDAGTTRSCRSPSTFTLRPGPHTVRVIAVDAAGNADRTPAVVRVKVVRKRS